MSEQTLVIASKVSRLFLSICLEKRQREAGKTIYLCLNNESFAALKGIGISPILLNISEGQSRVENDADFYKWAMPGGLNANLPSTDLPAWKVLSLDRLYFWFKNSPLKTELINSFRRDHLIVSLDIEEPILWSLACGESTTAVQCGSIMSRTMSDLTPYLPFSKIVTRDDASKKFLEKFGYDGGKIEVRDVSDYLYTWDNDARNKIREGLGIGDETVIGVMFDSQTEWAFRRWLSRQSLSNNPKIIVIADSGRNRKLLLSLISPEQARNILIADDLSMLYGVDQIISFRYFEEISRFSKVPVSVIDVGLRFRSGEITA